MSHLIDDLRLNLKRKRAYRTTLTELKGLPLAIKNDLGIAGNEEQLAYKAVYGA